MFNCTLGTVASVTVSLTPLLASLPKRRTTSTAPMIRYSKAWWSVSSLFTWYGSAVPRALPFALVAALVAGLCAGFASERLRGLWGHPYPYQMFAFIVGFLIVFRCA